MATIKKKQKIKKGVESDTKKCLVAWAEAAPRLRPRQARVSNCVWHTEMYHNRCHRGRIRCFATQIGRLNNSGINPAMENGEITFKCPLIECSIRRNLGRNNGRAREIIFCHYKNCGKRDGFWTFIIQEAQRDVHHKHDKITGLIARKIHCKKSNLHQLVFWSLFILSFEGRRFG